MIVRAAPADTGTADRNAECAEALRCVDGSLNLGRVGHVGLLKHDRIAELLRERLTFLGVHVDDDRLAAIRHETTDRRLAEPGGPSRHQCHAVLDLHARENTAKAAPGSSSHVSSVVRLYTAEHAMDGFRPLPRAGLW